MDRINISEVLDSGSIPDRRTNTLDIMCGPLNDQRNFRLSLPWNRLKIGVFLSGGIDSAILYYILMKLNHEAGSPHTITPYTILRKEGSRLFAKPVIDYVSNIFGIESSLNIVGDNTLPEEEQVKSGVNQILEKWQADIAYVGVIEQLSIHMDGWKPIPAKASLRFRTPLVGLNKSHIIDLVYKMGQEYLLEITHSCIYETGRCNTCNGCKERAWAFSQLGIEDIGKV